MFNAHFYHATLRKMITVFGALFNNISVVRKDGGGNNGNVTNITRVPIAYGPKQKFLARIDEQPDLEAPRVAIKLPRMSFEIIGLTYDAADKLNRNNTISVPVGTTSPTSNVVKTFAPYKLAIQLSVMAKNQDDALQVVEQILPYFQPEYTVSIKDVEGLNIVNDVPIIITGIRMNEDYEGDFIKRRAIIYDIDFELKVRFYGPVVARKTIATVITNIKNEDTSQLIESIQLQLNPINASPTSTYSVVETIAYFTNTDQFNIMVYPGTGGFTAGETITGSASGSSATVASFDAVTNVLNVSNANGPFRIGEALTGSTSHTQRAVISVTQVYTD